MHREILDDLLKDSPCTKNGLCNSWCFIRELFENAGLSDRMAEQVRLMYDYKYLKSKREGKDIGKERAFNEFSQKYGKKFDRVYQDGMKNDELFLKVFGIKKKHTDYDIRVHMKN